MDPGKYVEMKIENLISERKKVQLLIFLGNGQNKWQKEGLLIDGLWKTKVHFCLFDGWIIKSIKINISK